MLSEPSEPTCVGADVFPVDLLGLLNWRSNPEDLDQSLQRLMEVEGGEIVKVSALGITNAALNM